MGESGVGDEIATQGGEMDDDESGRERFFTVGEVVELWEGAFVRGYLVCLLLLRGWKEMGYIRLKW